MTGRGFIHMVSTCQARSGRYGAECRCGWRTDDHATRGEARVAGDAHLAEANAS